MQINEICQVIQDISNLSVCILSTKEELQLFCRTWQFHSKQDYLNPDTLEWLFNSLDTNKILCYLDCFRIRFSFLWIDKERIALGPYCTEILTQRDCEILAKQANLKNLPITDVLAYRSKFPILKENSVLHLAYCLTKHMLDELSTREVLHIDSNNFYSSMENELSALYKPYSAMVQERYKTELEFMNNIRMGNRNAALKSWKSLHDSVDFIKRKIGYTIEEARTSAAITRTTIRLAGIEAGLPAELGDWLTGQSAQNIRSAKTIEAINQEHERLILEYCKVIHEYRNKVYSNIVLSTLYQLEHLFHQEIKVSNLAAELDVSVDHLIKEFKKETGFTPGQYLQKKRLEHAAWLLVSTNLPIQEICADCGIPDANYFSKLFHRQYKESPTVYRKGHHL